jgi:hypothetical protein
MGIPQVLCRQVLSDDKTHFILAFVTLLSATRHTGPRIFKDAPSVESQIVSSQNAWNFQQVVHDEIGTRNSSSITPFSIHKTHSAGLVTSNSLIERPGVFNA